MTAILELTDVEFGYGTFQVLFGVSLHLEQGEILALLGTNGAGKSTLLRVLTGLDKPQAGTILFDGRDVTGWAAEKLCATRSASAYFPWPSRRVASCSFRSAPCTLVRSAACRLGNGTSTPAPVRPGTLRSKRRSRSAPASPSAVPLKQVGPAPQGARPNL